MLECVYAFSSPHPPSYLCISWTTTIYFTEPNSGCCFYRRCYCIISWSLGGSYCFISRCVDLRVKHVPILSAAPPAKVSEMQLCRSDEHQRLTTNFHQSSCGRGRDMGASQRDASCFSEDSLLLISQAYWVVIWAGSDTWALQPQWYIPFVIEPDDVQPPATISFFLFFVLFPSAVF